MKRANPTPSRSLGPNFVARVAAACALVALPLAAWFGPLRAQTSTPPPTGQSFLVLDPDENGNPRVPARFTQELFATTPLGAFSGQTAKVLGGVAFAPNGDVWSAECLSNFSTLHRFSRSQYRDLTPSIDNHFTITPRVELSPVATEAGCGIVNHPDGLIYSNNAAIYEEDVSSAPIAAESASSPSSPTVLYAGGVTRLHADTGLPEAWPNGETRPAGPAGNALGIATDPITLHLVYAGEDCDDKGELLPTCTLWSLDPGTATTPPSATMWAQLPHLEMPFVDGIYFSKDGQYLFVTNRTDRVYEVPSSSAIAVNHVTVLRRPASAGLLAQAVQHIPMATEPDGISFHTSGQFLVTNDEEGATMSRFDFPNGFDNPPSNPRTVTVYSGNEGETIDLTLYGTPFATHGHRGDLSQVGPDGCIYATQGRDFSIYDLGTRYDNGDVTTEDSIVKICATPGNGGFEPPPGVTNNPTPSGSIQGSAYLDVDGDGDGDSFLSDVPIDLTGAATGSTTTSGASVPTFGFASLGAGDYVVNAPEAIFGYKVVSSTPFSVPVTLASGEHRTGIDFLYVPGKLSGSVYFDTDDDGAIDVDGDALLANVPLTLLNGTTNAGGTVSGAGPATPTYTFPALTAGTYTVTAVATASGYQLAVAPGPQTLAAGGHVERVDFLFKGGRLSGYAYVDSDNDSEMDSGEPRLSNVTIAGPNGSQRETDANGFYEFKGLAAGTYALTADAAAQGFARTTASPLSDDLGPGQHYANLNFGYRPGRIAGYAYVDANRNGVKDIGEAPLSGVSIDGPGGSRSTDATGRYEFADVTSGTYTLIAPSVASNYGLFTSSSLTATVVAPGAPPDRNFGYVPGAISGFAYVDSNNNGTFEPGEPGLDGVSITLSGTASSLAPTHANGAYAFGNLLAGGYTVSAPATVGTYTRSTSGSLNVALPAGGNIPNLNFGYIPGPPPAPGSISGKAYIDTNGNSAYDAGEVILAGVSITVSGGASGSASGSASTTAPAGYRFANLASGGYSVAAASTAVYNGFTYNLTTLSPVGVPLAEGESRQNVDFGYRAAVVYTTYTQGGWGASPAGNNPGTVLANNFAAVYPSGVTIGWSGKYTLKFTSALAVRSFLPAGGAPKALKASAVNPTSSAAGVFAGQVLAATLSVDFSERGVTAPGLKHLRIATGHTLLGRTVEEALALANQALGGGGLPPGVSFSALNDVMTRINENFDNGTTNNGFLVP